MEDKLKHWLKQLKLNESTISMLLGGMVVVVVGILIYNYFSSVGNNNQELVEVSPTPGSVELVEEEGKMVPKDLPTTHTVVKGEYLWSISEKYYGNGYNWVDIARENKLAQANLLFEGQQLTIPRVEVKVAPKNEESQASANVIEGSTYTVVKGDSLWKIAVRTYQDGYKWSLIADANKDKLANPNAIEVGMVLNLPR